MDASGGAAPASPEPEGHAAETDEELARIAAFLRSPEQLQSWVYRAAGIAGITAFTAVQAAGHVENGSSGKPYFFSSGDYYSTAAQVLPVLLLAFAVEKSYFGREQTKASGVTAVLAFALVMLATVFGELFCLAVVGTSQPSGTLRAEATLWSATGVAGSLLLIVGQATIESGLPEFAADIADDQIKPRGDWVLGGAVLAAFLVVGVAAVVGDFVHKRAYPRWLAYVLAGGLALYIVYRVVRAIVGGIARRLRR